MTTLTSRHPHHLNHHSRYRGTATTPPHHRPSHHHHFYATTSTAASPFKSPQHHRSLTVTSHHEGASGLSRHHQGLSNLGGYPKYGNGPVSLHCILRTVRMTSNQDLVENEYESKEAEVILKPTGSILTEDVKSEISKIYTFWLVTSSLNYEEQPGFDVSVLMGLIKERVDGTLENKDGSRLEKKEESKNWSTVDGESVTGKLIQKMMKFSEECESNSVEELCLYKLKGLIQLVLLTKQGKYSSFTSPENDTQNVNNNVGELVGVFYRKATREHFPLSGTCRWLSIHPLQLLHMDLFGPTSVRSINHKTYCLVITDDFSRFSWTFFLRTKDETSAILKDFIRQIENQLNQKVKTIRCDNGTEFKNRDVIEFCGLKGIKREYSNARTPQQNGVAERKNRTLIEAARTMLADSFLPNTFWAEAVSTACYVLNRVLVTKPHNKTPYELLTGKTPIISYIRPFGCHVTILNTIDHLGKFAGKSDEGFLVGYSLQSKAFRVYNLETKRVEENLHINFLENKPNVAGKGPNWLFDLDYLTDSMKYHSVSSENQANLYAVQQESNQNTGTKDKIDAGEEDESAQDCFEMPIWHSYSFINTSASKSDNKRGGPREEEQVFLDDLARLQRQEKEANEEAEALLKNIEQETENLVTQGGAAKLILQVVLDLQHFKSSLFIFAATILQSSSAIHHISNIDNYVHQIIKFQSILITSSHSLWSSQSFGHQKGVYPWSTKNHFNSQYMKHWASQSFGT
ncbi:putative ribonuclease H-like domain-containing protein [Tanacetum coccineum]